MTQTILARIFHTAARRVRARGLQTEKCAPVGRVPSRGALWPIRSQCAICGLACVLFCLAMLTAWAEPTIEQWGRFELALNGPTNGNPFLDVKFSVRFWQRQFETEANGFYDGDGIYRARFMPEKPGEWHYLTVSSSPELNGQTGVFTVTETVGAESRTGSRGQHISL